MDISRPYEFNTQFRAYNSPNVKEVSAGGLRITATAQFVIRYCGLQKILVPRSSGMKSVLGVDIAVRGVDIAIHGVDIATLGVDISSLDVDIGVGE